MEPLHQLGDTTDQACKNWERHRIDLLAHGVIIPAKVTKGDEPTPVQEPETDDDQGGE